MTPSPKAESRSIFTNSVSTHVLPPSSLRSTNAFQTLLSSLDAGASHVPFDKIIGLFLTGPRPPLSPATSSFASDHVSPLSLETWNHVSQKSIVLPTLKNSVIVPLGSLNNTGFQCASSRIFAISFGGDQLPGSPFDNHIPTSSCFSCVPPNHATRNLLSAVRRTVEA